MKCSWTRMRHRINEMAMLIRILEMVEMGEKLQDKGDYEMALADTQDGEMLREKDETSDQQDGKCVCTGQG